LRNIAQNCAILPSNIAQKLVGNIAQYCTILRNIAQYCTLLRNIANQGLRNIAQYFAKLRNPVQTFPGIAQYLVQVPLLKSHMMMQQNAKCV
jgi:hypothetical protein